MQIFELLACIQLLAMQDAAARKLEGIGLS